MYKYLSVIFILTLCTIALITPAENAAVITKRAAAVGDDDHITRICETYHTPCGWAVYTPFKRTIDYFMRNPCKCSDGLKCIKAEDDASVSAYVYKCRNRTTTSTDATEYNSTQTTASTLSTSTVAATTPQTIS